MKTQQEAEATKLNIQLEYPFNDKFDYEVYLDRMNLDETRVSDIKSGKGFFITSSKSIKKDLKDQDGIFSSRYGNTMQDSESYIDRYRCKCGYTRGTINHGLICPNCGHMVKYVDDDMYIFGWIVLKESYFIIHPNLYRSLEAFIGPTRLDNIIGPHIEVDGNGREVERVYKKDEIFAGIGIMEFRDRFDEIMAHYLSKYPAKKNYYDSIMQRKNIVFAHSIPVFTTLLRPTKFENASLKYEKTNENYMMIIALVQACNNDALGINRKRKDKLGTLYDIQYQFNIIYNELKDILSHKRGDLRTALGGRYAFSSRSVIVQNTDLRADQVRLPYHGLCELLQQVIINILIRTYNFSYADAYKYWYKAQLGFSDIVYSIIDNLIKDSEHGLKVLINRNPTINMGSIFQMYVVGINKDYTMGIPLQVLKPLAADFDGDTLNILYLYNKDFSDMCEKVLNPRTFFISRNDGRFNNDMNFARDTIINANAMKSLCKYTDEEIQAIRRLQQMG